jgi:hypothetical protein
MRWTGGCWRPAARWSGRFWSSGRPPFYYGFQGEYAKLIKALAADAERNRQITGDMLALVPAGAPGYDSGGLRPGGPLPALAGLLGGTRECPRPSSPASPPRKAGRKLLPMSGRPLKVLVATLQLIGEGFDCPGLSTLVLATPIKFEGRLLQVVGRIMRPAEGKRARVIDYVDEQHPCAAPLGRRPASGFFDVVRLASLQERKNTYAVGKRVAVKIKRGL